MVSTHLSRVFLVVTALYTGGQPVRRLTRGSFFVEGCLRALTREVCFREMLSRTLLFSTFWKRELPHLHGHIFLFIGTSSPSRAHLPPHLSLHWQIFPFRQVGGGVGWAWFASARAFARLSPGYARDPEWKTPNQINGALAYAKLPQICLRRLLTRRLSWSFR